jgi:hypothetical protein
VRAERQYGTQIATHAYELWLLAGRNPGTVGADDWKKGKPALQEQIGTPAFDSWVSKGAPVQGVNSSWRDAIGQWEKDGSESRHLPRL